MAKPPSYDGAGLVNLVSEIELRLTGLSKSPRMRDDSVIPDGSTYVLVLFDGLGAAQLEHPAAGSLQRSSVGTIEAPFPTTTSVSLATIATGVPPSRHAQVAHLLWMPDLGRVVNSLKWVDLAGKPVPYDYSTVLPTANLWERLRHAGVEPITVQPGDFSGSPLTRVLYRGARFEPAWNLEDLVTATVQLAGSESRFIFTYVPHVDFAGHVHGLASDEFAEAIAVASDVWERIAATLPPHAVLVGTADHGLLEFDEDQKQLIRDPRFDGLRFAGDTRGVQLWGDGDTMRLLADTTGGELADGASLLGPEPTPTALARVGDRLLLPPDDVALLPRGFDKRLRCYHGGLSKEEVEIPLLVG